MTDIVHKSNMDEVSMCKTLLEITHNLKTQMGLASISIRHQLKCYTGCKTVRGEYVHE